MKEDIERTSFYAYVGGSSSFDALSMKLKINKRVQLKKWNYEKQRYEVKKTLSDETIKPKNDDGAAKSTLRLLLSPGIRRAKGGKKPLPPIFSVSIMISTAIVTT